MVHCLLSYFFADSKISKTIMEGNANQLREEIIFFK